MKAVFLSAAAIGLCVFFSLNSVAQLRDSSSLDTERSDTDVRRGHRPGDRSHPDQKLSPESSIPRRSPDLGEPYFPLSPSIGPGSGLLGPEAGRGPARMRSDAEHERTRTR